MSALLLTPPGSPRSSVWLVACVRERSMGGGGGREMKDKRVGGGTEGEGGRRNK